MGKRANGKICEALNINQKKKKKDASLGLVMLFKDCLNQWAKVHSKKNLFSAEPR